MAFCSKCGNMVEPGLKFCPTCGSPMQPGRKNPFTRPEIIIPVAVLAVALIIAAAAAAFFLFRGNGSQGASTTGTNTNRQRTTATKTATTSKTSTRPTTRAAPEPAPAPTPTPAPAPAPVPPASDTAETDAMLRVILEDPFWGGADNYEVASYDPTTNSGIVLITYYLPEIIRYSELFMDKDQYGWYVSYENTYEVPY